MSKELECTSETDILNLVRLEATRLGMRLWRNNVGATYMKDGRFIRYGLANESQRMNAAFKSGDLIGIYPRVITQDDVGKTIGQFISREVKRKDWVYRGTAHEKAQQAWIDLINKLGGDAKFTTGKGSFYEIITQ